jgi:tripartite ATP-independent transporter DctM subunit
MSWELPLILIFGGMLFMMATGIPIAFAFLTVVLIGAYTLLGGLVGLEQVILSITSTLTTFTLLPVPLFLLMGDLMVQSGIAMKVIDVLNKWLGKVPGRLGLLSVLAGTLLATLTGASMASTATLGSVLVPEMKRRGYSNFMTIGPILGSGGLAIMIPPSSLAIILGAIGEISIGRILVAIITPGVLMALFYCAFIVIACLIKPSLAPSYDVEPTPFAVKLGEFVRYVLPTGLIIFLVIGLIFFGVAGPSESAASGVVGMLLLLVYYGRLKWSVLKESLRDTLRITGMVFMIIAGSQVYSQILSFSGATQGLIEYSTRLNLPPTMVVMLMQVIILIMGCFMDPVGILLITLPIFMPVIRSLGLNEVWFAAIMLLNIEMAMITPPFGMCLFIMKGVVGEGATMLEIYKAGTAFIGLQIIIMLIMILFPPVVLWLPSVM